jgi:hypothetical protein
MEPAGYDPLQGRIMVPPKKDTKKEGSTSRRTRTSTGPSADWRDERLSRIRRLIREADPEVVEQQKWKKPSNPAGIPVWYHDGIICTGETYKNHLRFTFAQGGSLKDPKGVFNANLEGATRALVIHEGDQIDETAFKARIRAAAALNSS